MNDFETWWEEFDFCGNNKIYVEKAWNHQQAKIDALEKFIKEQSQDLRNPTDYRTAMYHALDKLKSDL